ncbi:hypothetical protein C8R45DRAFT_374169 [Mycena sanguinolenta]|nr:hypothetical protein C8R45DRAFT_374169 [Mycena sanguinolenta]
MPALEAFSIEHHDLNKFNICLPSSSSSRLRIFRAVVHYPITVENDLQRVVEMFPHLTKLSIDVPTVITDTAISRLAQCNDVGPELELLRLSNRSFRQLDGCKWKTLADMLHARFRRRAFTFEFPTDDWANDVDVTMALKTLKTQNHWDIRVSASARSLLGTTWI